MIGNYRAASKTGEEIVTAANFAVGTVKCTITTNKSGYWARVKCDDQANF